MHASDSRLLHVFTFLKNQAKSLEPGEAPMHCTARPEPSLASTSSAANAISEESVLGLAWIPMLAQTGEVEQVHAFQFKSLSVGSILHLGSGWGREISGVDPH